MYRPADAAFYLRDTFPQPYANHTIELGTGHEDAVAGAWGG